jgi:serine/threonine protein kinase
MGGALVPKELGRYQLTERLAVGGMAELYRAKMKGAHDFAKAVVIKKILPSLSEDEEFVKMFIDEAKLTSHLQHPNIVQVFELGLQKSEFFIAMEFIDGIDVLAMLRDFAKRGARIPSEVAVHIMHEVLDALDYAHHATDDRGVPLNIVHRDVTPGNILVSVRGDVKITDFGIARAAANQTQTMAGTLKGKYGYMSPEQVNNGPLDGRSDVFAAAVVLAEMLMGRRLFLAPNDLDVLLMVREVNLERWRQFGPGVEPSLQTLIEKELQKDPNRRFASAGAFRDALADWIFQTRRRVGLNDIAAIVHQVRARAEARLREDESQLHLRTATGTQPAAAVPSPAQQTRTATTTDTVTAPHDLDDSTLNDVREPQSRTRGNAWSDPDTSPREDSVIVSGEYTSEIGTGDIEAIDVVSEPVVDPQSYTENYTIAEQRAAFLEAEADRPVGADGAVGALATQSILSSDLARLLVATGGGDNPNATSEIDLSQIANLIGQTRGVPPREITPSTLSDGIPDELPTDIKTTRLKTDGISSDDDITAFAGARVDKSDGPIEGGYDEVPQRPPDARGSFADTTPVHVLYRLGASRATGLLHASLGSIQKSFYFVMGIPQIAHSNIGSEQLGDVLVKKQKLEPGELAMALAVASQFKNDIALTLLSLALIDETELAEARIEQLQVKVKELTTWERGAYSWFNGEVSRGPEQGTIDLWATIGGACMALPPDQVLAWVDAHQRAALRPKTNRFVPLDAFRLGTRPRDHMNLCDGKQTLKQVSELFPDPRVWHDAARVFYLLVQTEQLELWQV